MPPMKIWILGGYGFIGRALSVACMQKQIAWVASSRDQADVTDLERLLKIGDCIRPTHIINCAAIADVEQAQMNPEDSFLINARGAKNAALAAIELGADFSHLSTDYVFDGASSRPYREDDPCRGLNTYAQSKLRGEEQIREVMPQACILRTSWVFGIGGKNSLSLWPQRFQKEEKIQVETDQISSPTYVHDLAVVILDMLGKSGTYHFANRGELSRFHIASSLHQALLRKGVNTKCQEISPVKTSINTKKALRPAYSVLDTTLITKTLGRMPRSWEMILEEYIKELCV